MIRPTSQTSTPDSAFAAAPSRTADKFVLPISVELNEALVEVARSQYRSFNSEVSLAVISMLEDHRRLITMRNSLSRRLGPEIADRVLEGIERIDPTDGKPHTANVRFPDGLRERLTSASASKRTLVAKACADWVYYSCQIEALLARCDDSDVQHPTPRVTH